jgi:hypothetical protein
MRSVSPSDSISSLCHWLCVIHSMGKRSHKGTWPSLLIDDVREKIEISNVEAEKNVSCTLSPILAQAV